MPEIISIIDNKQCYGCEACYNTCQFNAITMKKVEDGFRYPVVDKDKCIECVGCSKNCPAIPGNMSVIKDNKYKQRVYSVRLKDTGVRKISSSGGAFTAISDKVLEQHGCVVGVVWNNDFSVKHIIATELYQRDMMRQSKYIQSEIGSCYKLIKEKIKNEQLVLFTGTPCQNAGLKLYLGNMDLSKLILCDVLCGGNVSPVFFKDYLKYIEKKQKDKVTDICFRTKIIGWKQHHILINLKKTIYQGARRDNEPFFYLYLKKYIIRKSCFSCSFASIDRITDITLGDFWGIDQVEPEIDDDLGISFVSVNTQKGQDFISSVTDKIMMEEREINLAIPRQINLRKAAEKPEKYELFWEEYKKFGSEYILKKYTTFGMKNKIRCLMKKFFEKYLNHKE